ncbi:MAG: iron-containing alcohol dehydrogenase family protein [bacterium]
MTKPLKIDLPEFFEVGEHKTLSICKILRDHDLKFKKVLLLGDHKTFLIGGGPISKSFEDCSIKVLKHLISNSDEPNVEHVEKLINEQTPDLVLGFGGGKVLDVAKLAAGNCKKKYISIPTTLSNDGISSPVSVITNKEKLPISHITKAPCAVIVDTSIIKRAPTRHIKAGVGDIVSNLSAVSDARLAESKGKGKTNDTALSLAEAGALKILDSKATSVKDDDFLITLTQGLIKSGFAMCIVGSSRPASGSEHKISHAIDYLYSPTKNLHGEQVGIAAVFTMVLQENKYFKKVIALYDRIAFPHKLKKLHLNFDQFVKVVMHAPKIRPDRYTILEDRNLTSEQIKAVVQACRL